MSKSSPYYNPANPCPVCNTGSKSCRLGDDGELQLCRLPKGENPDLARWHEIPSKDADHDWRWFIPRHVQDQRNAEWRRGQRPKRPAMSKSKNQTKDWGKEAERFALSLSTASERLRSELPRSLRLPAEAIASMPMIGMKETRSEGSTFTFPECDGTGQIIGINRRFPNGDKQFIKGGKRGLTLPVGWRDRDGPIFIVEGASDTLAMTHAGLACVGRPSAMGGAEHLAELLKDWPEELPIIVVGENDERPSKTDPTKMEWPGKDGAENVAKKLAAKLNRCVAVAFPPKESKDARDWLTHDKRGDASWQSRGAELRDTLMAHAEVVESTTNPTAHLPESANDAQDDPHRLATEFLLQYADKRYRKLQSWKGDFYSWKNGGYIGCDDVDAELTHWLRRHFELMNRKAQAMREGDEDGKVPTTHKVTMTLVRNVINALQGECLVRSALIPPCWLGGSDRDTSMLLALRNGILDLAKDSFEPATPEFFTLNALGFDHDPNAGKPVEWLKFLKSVWPDDQESIDCLQDWFGYLLTPDTRQQKMLMFIGPRRSGKGTICRVLKELVGERNFAGPTLGGLAQNFGLSSLLDKLVGCISDARLSGRTDTAIVVERLLSITGEDSIDIDRKHKSIVTTKLPTRFVLVSNELPKLGDSSGALAGRMILLRTTETFYGKEDQGLTDRLLRELTGILLWAIEGWKRLHKRGRFIQPSTSIGLMEDMENIASPVGQFVRECCFVGAGESVTTETIYRAWKGWCQEHGRDWPGDAAKFGQQLHAAIPKLDKHRPRRDGKRILEYVGVRLLHHGEPEQSSSFDPDGHSGHSDQPMHQGSESTNQAWSNSHNSGAVGGHSDHYDHPDHCNRATERTSCLSPSPAASEKATETYAEREARLDAEFDQLTTPPNGKLFDDGPNIDAIH